MMTPFQDLEDGSITECPECFALVLTESLDKHERRVHMKHVGVQHLPGRETIEGDPNDRY